MIVKSQINQAKLRILFISQLSARHVQQESLLRAVSSSVVTVINEVSSFLLKEYFFTCSSHNSRSHVTLNVFDSVVSGMGKQGLSNEGNVDRGMFESQYIFINPYSAFHKTTYNQCSSLQYYPRQYKNHPNSLYFKSYH